MNNKIKDIVTERGKVYGPPAKNHSRTADLWTAYLHNAGHFDIILSAQDVCMFNILQKIARSQHGACHEDTIDDIAGFAMNIKEIWKSE